MAITVLDMQYDDHTYLSGKTWVIDPDNQLHVTGEKGNLASYAAGAWAKVYHSADPETEQPRVADRAHELRNDTGPELVQFNTPGKVLTPADTAKLASGPTGHSEGVHIKLETPSFGVRTDTAYFGHNAAQPPN